MKKNDELRDLELDIIDLDDFEESEDEEVETESEEIEVEAEEANEVDEADDVEEAADFDDEAEFDDDAEEADETDEFEGESEFSERKRRKARKKSRSAKKELFSWVMTFAVAFILAFFLKNYVIINAQVPTGSMENTILPGDQLFGYRLAYEDEDPERGDIIFFYFPDDETQKFVKRIIGLPGEKVTIKEGKIYINDSETPLDEPYLKEEWIIGTGPYEFNVPEDSYLCLGDNRNSSHDARAWKKTYVSRDKIIGKALYIYYPFEHMGTLE